MRFERVQALLEAEPAFRDRIGPKDQKIEKKNQTFLFSKGTIEVTRHLHQNGYDAHNADRTIVVAAASLVLKQLAPAKPTRKPVKPVKPVKLVKLAKPVKAKAKRPVTAPAQASAARDGPPAAKKPEPPAAKKPEPQPETKLHEPARKPEQPAAAAAEPAQDGPPPPPAPATDPGQIPVYYIYATTFTMLASIIQLLERADNQPGADVRRAKSDDLAEELFKLKDVGVPLPMEMLPNSVKNAKNTAPKN